MGPLPPHHRFRDFLPADDLGAMLAWVAAHRERFAPSKLVGGVLDTERRVSETTRDFPEIAPMLRQRFSEAFPAVLEKTGTRPFEAEATELELAAHGDGAHFAIHRDIPIGQGRRPLGGDGPDGLDRIVSAVLYFHNEPKRFTGGALRLHRFGSNAAPGDYVDLEPEGNSLVVFPAWAAHEVLPVHCPSQVFEDYRYAVNCWFCRTLR